VPNDIRLSDSKVGVIINTSSGGGDSESEQKIFSILTRAGIVEPKVWCGEAKEMERSFAEAARQKLEVLIVLGGDGTVRTVAETCAEKDSYLIPLPGGTMNMLPRALYGNLPWEEALKKTLTAPLSKSAFWRSSCKQTVFYRSHCGGACALDTIPRIYAGREYS
jgi:diacylglycerol kinase family enzyme